jgi:hypothetical protein
MRVVVIYGIYPIQEVGMTERIYIPRLWHGLTLRAQLSHDTTTLPVYLEGRDRGFPPIISSMLPRTSRRGRARAAVSTYSVTFHSRPLLPPSTEMAGSNTARHLSVTAFKLIFALGY